jgi:hypothetical protein
MALLVLFAVIYIVSSAQMALTLLLSGQSTSLNMKGGTVVHILHASISHPALPPVIS